MNARDQALVEEAAARLRPLIDAARTAVLTTHVTPDGDGIGAEICLHGYLVSRGIEARILNTEPLSPRYQFLDARGAGANPPTDHAVTVRSADMPAV